MDYTTELQNALRNFFHQQQENPVIVPAVVTEVRLEERECDVMFLGEFEIFNVRLRAAINNHPDHLLIIPEVGSDVLIGRIGDGVEYTVLTYSRVQALHYKVGTTELHVDADGFKIFRNGQDLGDQLQQLITQIQAITVPVAAAPGTSGPPVNVAAFTPIAQALTQILK